MKENRVASLLIRLRKDYGFTQSDLADRLDVSFQAVSKWERGENLPDAYTLLELAKIYTITVDEILKGELLYRNDGEMEEKISVKQIYTMLTVGIVLIVISPVWYFALKSFGYLNIIGIISSIAIGIGFVIYSGIQLENAKKASEDYRENTKLENVVYGISFVVFFVLGMGFELWNISWIAFIVGWIVIQALEKE